MTSHRATGSIALRRGLILAVALLFALEAFPAIWYVNKNAESGGDGTSWATAFQTIEPAVHAAGADGGGEVWIAEGRYGEVRQGYQGRLEIPGGVEVYGGFAGDENIRQSRDWILHECVIDGATSWNGAQAVYVISLMNENARIDGLTIQGGVSGVDASKQVMIANCTVRGTGVEGTALGCGIRGSNVTIEGCTIIANWGNGIWLFFRFEPSS
jgi:hypothetical protein